MIQQQRDEKREVAHPTIQRDFPFKRLITISPNETIISTFLPEALLLYSSHSFFCTNSPCLYSSELYPFFLHLELHFGDVKGRWKIEGDMYCETVDCTNGEKRREGVEASGEEEPAGRTVSEMEEMLARVCVCDWGWLLIHPGKAEIWFACHNRCFSLPRGRAILRLSWFILKCLLMYYLAIMDPMTHTFRHTCLLSPHMHSHFTKPHRRRELKTEEENEQYCE